MGIGHLCGRLAGRLVCRLGKHRDDRIQVICIGGLVDRNRDRFIRVAEIDLCSFGQFFDLCIIGVVDLQCVEVNAFIDGIAQLFQFRRQRERRKMHLQGYALQAFRAVIHRVHACHDGQQCLRGTDVGSGLVAADMLLARLQCHAQCRVALRIDGYADDAPGHGALVGFAAGKVRRVGSAVAHRDAEALRAADHHIGSPLARRRQQHQAQHVGRHGNGGSVCFGFTHKVRVIVNLAIRARILEQCAENAVVQLGCFEVADDQFDAHRRGACLQQIDGLRKAVAGYKELVRTAVNRLTRTAVEQHRHRFRGCGGFVQQ